MCWKNWGGGTITCYPDIQKIMCGTQTNCKKIAKKQDKSALKVLYKCVINAGRTQKIAKVIKRIVFFFPILCPTSRKKWKKSNHHMTITIFTLGFAHSSIIPIIHYPNYPLSKLFMSGISPSTSYR